MARQYLEIGAKTDVGRMRQCNEDSCVTFVPLPGESNPSGLEGLLLVADGMGGERAGDRASQMAAERVTSWIRSGEFRTWPEFSGSTPFASAIGQALRRISDEIYQVGEEEPEVRGLGSTLVLAALLDGRVVIAHVGDSRCYRVRGDRVEQLTADHSWVERQVRAGLMTSEQARVHPQRNILTRSLGDELTPDVDLRRDPLYDGDLFLLCSDGLTGSVTEGEILQLSKRHENLQDLVEALIQLANEKDGSDNITAVAGRWHGEETVELSSFDSEETQTLPRPDELVRLREARAARKREIDDTQPLEPPRLEHLPELDDTQPIPRPFRGKPR